MSQLARGMTLVEIMIALAIGSLMTLTGWRAVDALQASRDRVVTEAQQWQRVDDLFVTLEADLRRASISEFIGSSEAMTVLQPSLDGGIEVQTVRYGLAQAAGSATASNIIRETGGQALPMATVQTMSFTYSLDGTRFEPNANAYPRAVRVTLVPVGAAGPVERLFALR
jgi:prepilin-type N-terminal cleavage/methylation domain-containing protein